LGWTFKIGQFIKQGRFPASPFKDPHPFSKRSSEVEAELVVGRQRLFEGGVGGLPDTLLALQQPLPNLASGAWLPLPAARHCKAWLSCHLAWP